MRGELAGAAVSGAAARRWEKLARELEFTQLQELRRQAEGWRTGLTGLTALLAVLVLLKGRDSLTELPVWARSTATVLLFLGFALLVAGSLLAVRSAHGLPGEKIWSGGQALRRWTEREAARVTRALAWASVCCVLGLLLVVGAVVLAWAATEAKPTHLVRVTTGDGEVCGALVSADRDKVVVRVKEKGATTVVPRSSLVGVRPVAGCGLTAS